MAIFKGIFRSAFFIKLTSWEYWPFGILQAPLFPYWLWLSIKSRSLFFFSASNPGIVMGGMFGESKFDVLNKIPDRVKPKTILVQIPSSIEEVRQQLARNKLAYPLVFKPDLGERGWMVKIIKNNVEAEHYLQKIKQNFIIQEWVNLPLEFGVFYARFPSQAHGKVVSIVGKEMLHVVGNGKHTLRELIEENNRAKLQWKVLKETYSSQLDHVLANNEKMELVSIGNHCLGTKFLNYNHLISPQLRASFDALGKEIEGFYFGRFDLRTESAEALEKGDVKVVELNGCGAEPAHIYDPRFSFFKAVYVLFVHWATIYRISTENHKKGIPYISFREGKAYYRKFKELTSA
jgi:hypothetical protein